MTTRELQITKAVLDYLHSLDYGDATELQIHANAFNEWTDPRPSAGELNIVLENCNTVEGWINGVLSRFGKKMKWHITDGGEAARMEMR